MAFEFKKLSDVNVIEEMKDGLNVLVEDAGEIVKIDANTLIPEDVALKSDIPTKISELENDAVIPAPATAEVGQVVAVKAVDENGKPTEWELVNDLKQYIPFVKQGTSYICGITYEEANRYVSYGTNRAHASLNINEMDTASNILKAHTYYAYAIIIGIALGAGSNVWIQFEFRLSDGTVIKLRFNSDGTITEIE